MVVCRCVRLIFIWGSGGSLGDDSVVLAVNLVKKVDILLH